jgi:dsRNA-specific ribonuclease
MQKSKRVNIEAIKETLGILDLKKAELLLSALTHPSYIYSQPNVNQQQKDQLNLNYKRLAHLGDAILGAIVTDYLYNLPDLSLDQDALTHLKSKLVDRNKLSEFARVLQLQKNGLFAESKEQSEPTRLLSETFEALVGAIYLEFDRDFSRTRDWCVQRLIKKSTSDLLTNASELNQILSNLKLDKERYGEAIKQIEYLFVTASLRSQVGINYKKLGDLLTAGDWLKADLETRLLMLKMSKREVEGWLDSLHIQELPCIDLHTINLLWVRYSKGRFGFSVQARIWKQVNDFGQFSDAVGWRINGEWRWYDDLCFDLTAPQGHLPAFSGLKKVPHSRSLWAVHNGEPFAKKLSSCNIN